MGSYNAYKRLKSKDQSRIKSTLLDKAGKLKIVPASTLKEFPQEEISQFCAENGFYCIPTEELILFIKSEIDGDAVEIGTGHGLIAKSLGIKACDNFMQLDPLIKAHYENLRQEIVPYDKAYVINKDANSYVNEFKPKTVIAAWVTHKYDPLEHWREGNAFGVDEVKIVRKCKYIFVGNKKVHGNKPIFYLKYKEIKADWIFSRSMSSEENRIWIWDLV